MSNLIPGPLIKIRKFPDDKDLRFFVWNFWGLTVLTKAYEIADIYRWCTVI
jgi:hypothetical protein